VPFVAELAAHYREKGGDSRRQKEIWGAGLGKKEGGGVLNALLRRHSDCARDAMAINQLTAAWPSRLPAGLSPLWLASGGR